MAETWPIFKAKISSIDMSKYEARVLPLAADGVVTLPFRLYWPMRDGMSPLNVGDEVVCVRFEDGDGMVLCRVDGECNRLIPWDWEFQGNVTNDANVSTAGNETVSGDVTAGGISLRSHTHTGVHGETSGPH